MGKKRQDYSQEFKDQAMVLSDEIGATKAAERLGLSSPGVIGAWKRWASRKSQSEKSISGQIRKPSYDDLAKENAELRKQLREEKKVTEILKDATAFFSQHRLK